MRIRISRTDMVVLAAALALSLGTRAYAAGDLVPVETEAGTVNGSTEKGVAVFLGIPYAAPPVGDLRFRPPQPHAHFTAPFSATAYGSPCPQSARLGQGSLNEDCLFLNVWAPLTQGERKPVMLFIHGGGFTGGSSVPSPGGPDFGGVDIARKGNVVVVTINYRLGVLGYLAAPALDAENPRHVSGNYGLQDQQAALVWVRRNIEEFGGDPDNVTIFGESAGAASVLYQIVSPGAAGLFHRAISESGADSRSQTLAVGETMDAATVAGLGCANASDVAACLRALPVATIINSNLQTVGPVIDGVTLPLQPVDALASGQFNHVPTMIGTNLNEGTYFIAVAALGAGHALTAADYSAAIQANFPDQAAQIEAAYPLANYPTPADALAALDTDNLFACESERVRGLLASQVRVWGYEFAEPAPALNVPLPPAPGFDLGDAHTTELAYVFGHDGSGLPLPGRDGTLADEIIGYWTRFAASGNPNFARRHVSRVSETEGDRAMWPRDRSDQPLQLTLKVGPTPTADFAARHQCGLWQSLGYPEALISSVP